MAKNPLRSNKGGALRGKARSEQVRAMNSARSLTKSSGGELPGGNLQVKPAAAVKGLAKAASRKSRVR